MCSRTERLVAHLLIASLITALVNTAWASPPTALDLEARTHLLAAARASIARFVGGPPIIEADDLRLHRFRAGVFVTLELDGRVRGCRGTLSPITPSLIDEVRRNAVAAATNDRRFPRLRAADLARARISITVVTDLAPAGPIIDDLAFDEGLVVRCGDKVGVVLPYEGRDPRTRLDWGYRKAGVTARDACDIFRMRAIRFAEEVSR